MEKSFSERVAEAKAEVSSVSPQEANQHKEKNPHTVFIDPRDAADIHTTTGIIPGALNVPLTDLSESEESDLPQELSSRTRTIITACQQSRHGGIVHRRRHRASHHRRRRQFAMV